MSMGNFTERVNEYVDKASHFFGVLTDSQIDDFEEEDIDTIHEAIEEVQGLLCEVREINAIHENLMRNIPANNAGMQGIHRIFGENQRIFNEMQVEFRLERLRNVLTRLQGNNVSNAGNAGNVGNANREEFRDQLYTFSESSRATIMRRNEIPNMPEDELEAYLHTLNEMFVTYNEITDRIAQLNEEVAEDLHDAIETFYFYFPFVRVHEIHQETTQRLRSLQLVALAPRNHTAPAAGGKRLRKKKMTRRGRYGKRRTTRRQ